jgi:hypothetical protein
VPESTDASQIEQLRASIKNEVIQQFSKWLVAAVITAIGLSAIGWWLYLLPKITEITGGMPPGAVAAFDDPNDCPAGWVKFDEAAGRTIIGVGAGPGLTVRSYRDRAGEEEHTLTVPELPSHTHDVMQMVQNDAEDGVDSAARNSFEHNNRTVQSGATGGGRPHNNMPPFLALRFCKKK